MMFRRLQGKDPRSSDYRAKIGEGTLDYESIPGGKEAGRLSREHSFFHWELEFPSIYYDEGGDRRASVGVETGGQSLGGFDAIIGNPPWERVEVSTRDFFAGLYTKETGKAWNKADSKKKELFQKKMLKNKRTSDKFTNLELKFECLRDYFKQKYVLQSGGHAELFKLFIEQSFRLLAHKGSLGLLVPATIYSGVQCKDLRQTLFIKFQIKQMFSFTNRKHIFPNIGSQENFCVIIANSGNSTKQFDFMFKQEDLNELDKLTSRITITHKTIQRISGEGLEVPELDAEGYKIQSKILDFPTLEAQSPFSATSEFNMTFDKELFEDHPGKHKLPLYQGVTINQFRINHIKISKYVNKNKASIILKKRTNKRDKNQLSHKHGFADTPVDFDQYRLAWREVARNTDARTMIATILPPNVFHGHTLWSLRPVAVSKNGSYVNQHTKHEILYLCGIFNSVVFDFLIRQKVEKHVTKSIVQKIPVPRFNLSNQHHQEIIHLSAALICVSSEYLNLRQYVRPPDIKIGHEVIEAQINAHAALAYKLNIDELNYILTKFPVYKKKRPSFAKNTLAEYHAVETH